MTTQEERTSRIFAGVVIVAGLVLAALIVVAVGSGIRSDQVTVHRVTGSQSDR